MKKIITLRVIITGILTAALLTFAALVLYRMYAQIVRETDTYRNPSAVESSLEVKVTENPSASQLEKLFIFQYVLYKDLYVTRLQRKGETASVRYQDLYFGKPKAEEKFPEYLAYLLYLQNPDIIEEEELRQEWRENYYAEVYGLRENFENILSQLEQREFSDFNEKYDYWIWGTEAEDPADFQLTNTDTASEPNGGDYAFLYRIDYDEFGVPAISDFLYAYDAEELRKDVNSILHKNQVEVILGRGVYDLTGENVMNEAVRKETEFQNPVNCSILFGMKKEKWIQSLGSSQSGQELEYYLGRFSGLEVNLAFYAMMLFAGALGALYLNPAEEKKAAKRAVLRLPLEAVLLLSWLTIGFFFVDDYYYPMTNFYLGKNVRVEWVLTSLFVFYLASWYLGGCFGEIRTLGFSAYMDQRCLIMKNWNTIKKLFRKFVDSYREIDLGEDLRKKLFWIIAGNAAVLMLICCLWFFGVIGICLYSVALYFLGMKYLSKIQGEYRLLHQMTKEMATGNLKYEPEDFLGVFEPLRGDLVSIRDGFDAAVQEEVKSQRMKTELITNVSHDLKTPLTAIITYINLLKEKDLTQEQRSQYLDTLEKKSLRLKTLIEDLFEVSKANSGNVQLNLQSCDLVNLLKQVSLEMQDKLEEKHLAVRLLLPEEKVTLQLDSEKTYRVYENLFGNVAKYAMEGTRVYVGLIQNEKQVSVVIKNITEAEISVPPEELTERFVRGDVSRGSVEGSGLGLAIVRSFTELQGGKLEIEIDGDLFKVTTIWRKADRPDGGVPE